MVAAGMSVPWVGEALGWWSRGRSGEPFEDAGPGESASGTLVTAATSLRPALVYVRGGEFEMGSPPGEEDGDDDETQHRVRVSSFVMCETEVTQGQFKAVTSKDPSNCDFGCGDSLPVQSVSWSGATVYLDALSTREGLRPCYAERTGEEVRWDLACDGYRLPTEAEWEYAARAGTTTAFSFGDRDAKPDEYAWYSSNAGAEVKQVRTRRPNPWHLYDMHGNVWEWVWDVYDKNYGVDVTQVTSDPRGPSQNVGDRVLRGGSFDRGPWHLRSAHRFGGSPTNRGRLIGFRCVRGSRPQR